MYTPTLIPDQWPRWLLWCNCFILTLFSYAISQNLDREKYTLNFVRNICVWLEKIRWSINWWSNFLIYKTFYFWSFIGRKIYCLLTYLAYLTEPRPWFHVKSISASTQRMSLVREVTHRTHFSRSASALIASSPHWRLPDIEEGRHLLYICFSSFALHSLLLEKGESSLGKFILDIWWFDFCGQVIRISF